MLLHEKEHKLESVLAQNSKVAVAFSGGADSSLLLQKTLEVLGPENVLILTAKSLLSKKNELEHASTWLSRHGHGDEVRHEFIEIQPLLWDEFVQNPSNRCYLCKLKVYRIFYDVCNQNGITQLIDGTNFDDLHSDRPGLKALRELNIGTPLADAQLTKVEVRNLSNRIGLDTWDHPSASCLATRIPDGLEITHERIALIDNLEGFLESMGFKGCRVRLDKEKQDHFFIQVQEKDVAALVRGEIRSKVKDFFNDFGVKKVFLDLEGR